MTESTADVIRQHLIDPEICIRCNTCEATCPVGAITHDSRNYVVDAGKCNLCMACVPPCPTGSIDNWRAVPRVRAYSVEEQFGWDELPPELPAEQMATADDAAAGDVAALAPAPAEPAEDAAFNGARYNSTVPPWSAAHPYTNLYGPRAPEPFVTATVAGNVRVTEVGREYDTHHLVLDFGNLPFPVLEGQSIGILPPGTDDAGRAHHPRQYSVASPRNGERPGYNNVALTVKRVTADRDGNPVRGIASNFLCDLKKGDQVAVAGPFGASFLMPNHPASSLIMICTGTGSAPMRAMTERRRRRMALKEGGELLLFFGARNPDALPYFGPLQKLPSSLIDVQLAFSRLADKPKEYVQDRMQACGDKLARLLGDDNSYIFICGHKQMEEGVEHAFAQICQTHALDWPTLRDQLRASGRYHVETY